MPSRTSYAAACVSAAVMLLAADAQAADPVKAEVIDNWGTGAERAAVQVIQNAFAKRGGQLTSTVVANGVDVTAATVDRILAGQPPSAATFTPSSLYLDLMNKGQLNDVDDVAQAGKWRDVLPKFLIDAISFKGKIYIAPISMTVTDWVYSNLPLLHKAGIQSLPTMYNDEFFADLDKLKAAGIQPLGMGGDDTVYRWTFESIMAAVGGKDLWLSVWDNKDETAVRGPLMHKVFETFKRLHDYTDAAASGRSWAAAADMVVAGQAAITITGDWGKAEFTNAGKVAGKDFECQLQGNPALFPVHGDMFGFPASTDPSVIAGQKLLAQTLMDKDVQTQYNIIKSGNPARVDIDVANNAKFDECSKKGAAAYKSGDGVLGSPQWYLTPDGAGAFSDMLADYFNYPEMSTDQVIDQFWQVLSSDKVQGRS